MAKRGRAISIDRLVKQLSQLEKDRKALTARIREAIGNIFRDDGAPSPLTQVADGVTRFALGSPKRGRPAGAGKKRKMSAAARKAISDAQKKRWAKQKAEAK